MLDKMRDPRPQTVTSRIAMQFFCLRNTSKENLDEKFPSNQQNSPEQREC